MTALLVSFSGNGQPNEDTDTATILDLIAQSSRLKDAQPAVALQLLNDALTRSNQSDFIKGTSLAYAKLGRWYFGNNVDSSVFFAKKALFLFETKGGLPEDKADMHLLLAEAFDEQGHTDSSAYYYFLLGDEIESGNITNPEVKVSIYTKLAIFWQNVNFGNVTDKKVNETTRGYIEKVKLISAKMKNPEEGLAGTYFLQGIYFHNTGEYDSARYYYKVFLQLKEKLGTLNVLRKISTLTNIADTYLLQEQPDSAMPYITQVKSLGSNPDQKKYLGFFMAYVGMFEGKALYQQKQYAPAIEVLEQSLQQLNNTGGHLRQDVVDAYKVLGDAYQASGNSQQALTNRNTYITLKDSLSKKEKIDIISRNEIRYRIAQKDKELVEQQLTIIQVKSKVRNKNLLIAGILALFVFAALLLISWRKRNLQKQKLQQRNIEALQQKIKIERLNATIAGEEKERVRIARELHDGVGGLITAAKINLELVKKNNGKENDADLLQGIRFLEEAGDELRQAARNLMPEILLQEGLVKAMQVFCERVSEKSDAEISFQSFGDKKITDTNFELSIYRIIQELVHNIVKHSRAKNALVQINFLEDGGLNITVEDDGVGINKTTVTTGSTGMGLKNIQDRIRETGGKLDIKSEDGKGTSFYIEYDS